MKDKILSSVLQYTKFYSPGKKTILKIGKI